MLHFARQEAIEGMLLSDEYWLKFDQLFELAYWQANFTSMVREARFIWCPS